ncbi:hypothetical protein [Gallaecimonas xiamenensis]|uniref:Uncharacterized protein n=1 Tax=Gallaecimonas xiamenensis 3-C-1 TaxID=745411 RepID=K2IY77_9GAMM|nr:hypothetical protein [Gallaecimonas xiamenensis]EKE75436.1 hypothetical protein B3C1_07159 [Gallaecimonas xiamenensis 3-C-1]
MATMDTYRQQAIALAHRFRLGLNTEAALDMVELLGALAGDFAPAEPQQQQTLNAIMTLILQCQERQDWLGLADYLEYELVQLLAAKA